MIRELHVENIAIIDRATLTLESGLTVLTGETGAGKSLLIDAINLALGGRADSDLIRSGSNRASVNVVAALGSDALKRQLKESGLSTEGGDLSIQRDVSSEGRSTVRLNGRPVSVTMLREIGYSLVDLHGQHDHQALLVPEKQVEFLDAWIGQEASTLLESVAAHFDAVEALKRKLAHLKQSRRDREQRLDMLGYQIQEIEAAGISIGESESLQAQIERLKHSERLRTAAHDALARVSESEGSALENLGRAVRELENASSMDSTLASTVDPLREGLTMVQEAMSGLRDYLETLDADPATLESAAARLDSIKRLLRKYGETEEAVLNHLHAARAELETLSDSQISEDDLQAQLTVRQSELQATCATLTSLRTRKAADFSPLVQGHIRELAMDKAEFSVAVEPKAIDATGADLVTFLFSANAGEPAKSLSKVASGGEISRVMLAIKVASAGRAGVPTLIFDEVDTGLSGRAAAVTAKKLGQLAKHYQVLAISHLPQIAAQADHHFRIEKAVVDGRTVTRILQLEGEKRIAEVARMLAGEEVGESALANARELVAARL